MEKLKVKIKKLNCFYININFDFLKYPIKMNILINSKISPEINFGLFTTGINSQDESVNAIKEELFGKKQKSTCL